MTFSSRPLGVVLDRFIRTSPRVRSLNFRFADHPDHCRSGPLESPHQSVEPGCGFVEAFEHVDLAVLADKRDGESVAVRMKADAPGQDGVRRRIQRGELLLDAGFDIDRDQPLTGSCGVGYPSRLSGTSASVA